jgi:hypothetical protein
MLTIKKTVVVAAVFLVWGFEKVSAPDGFEGHIETAF